MAGYFSKYAPQKRASVSVKKVELDLTEAEGSSVSQEKGEAEDLEKKLENAVAQKKKFEDVLRELKNIPLQNMWGSFAPSSPEQRQKIIEGIQGKIDGYSREIAEISGKLEALQKDTGETDFSFLPLYKSELSGKNSIKPSQDNLPDTRDTKESVPGKLPKFQQEFEEEQSRIFEEHARIEEDRFQMQLLREQEEMWEEEEREEEEEFENDPFWDEEHEF